MDEILAYIEEMQEQAQESWVSWAEDPVSFDKARALGKMHGQLDHLAFLARRVKR